MKDSEISIYKLQLENQNYRDCIKSFNRLNSNSIIKSSDLLEYNEHNISQVGNFYKENNKNETNIQTIKSISYKPSKVINYIHSLTSNSSLSNTANLNTSTEKYNNIEKYVKMFKKSLNLEELAEEIRRAERNIQQYTKDLKECEFTKVRMY